MSKPNIKRILTIDLMRAFAVFMMIQGHTTHSLLNVSTINTNSTLYQTWIFFRAFTAPLFIFSSGLVFSYLLFQRTFDYKTNPRISKGIYRGISLIIIGYLLRFPTIKIFNIGYASYSQWLTFFTVDALHLIGVGILLIIFFAFVSAKIHINPLISFSVLTVAVFLTSPIIRNISWDYTDNIFIASYFTTKFGSIFPIFPYLQFIFLGSVFGIVISKNREIIKSNKNLFAILVGGILFFSLASYAPSSYYDSFLRFGAILILFSTFGFIGANRNSLPNIVESFSKNSLWIYIIHLIILYGSPTSLGMSHLLRNSLSAEATIFAAVLMVILMTIISLGIDKFRLTKYNFFK